MKTAGESAARQYFFGMLLLLIGLFIAMPGSVQGQCNGSSLLQGFNTVYGNCPPGPTQGTFAMVDAWQYNGAGDICAAIRAVFNSSVYNQPTINGIVVDARGFKSGQAQPCSDNPWDPSLVTALPSSSVILLPSGTIQIANTWAMPNNARLVGEGPSLTVIQATSIFNGGSGGDMIDMGNSSICSTDCPGVVIEHLGLNGSNLGSVNGIVNSLAQELSYVDDVAFADISGIGLKIATKNAANSGPYSKLTMSSIGQCVMISNGGSVSTIIYDTRGIHGLTCNGATTNPAIYVEGSNQSFEDVSIVGTSTSTQDGILIGGSGVSQVAAQTLMFNIRGSGLKNVIHISGSTNTYSSGSNPPCPYYTPGSFLAYNVCDVTILGLTNAGSGTVSIQDDITNTTLSNPSDATVGMYIVGEPVLQGSPNTGVGASRFTTSLSVPAWLVGTTAPSSTCASTGTLYSRTTGAYVAPPNTLFGCIGGTWTGIK